MGHSANVQSAEKANTTFSNFLNQEIKNGQTRLQPAIKQFESNINNFYKTYKNDFHCFGYETKWDFRQTGENDLNVVKPFMEGLAKNVIAGLPIPGLEPGIPPAANTGKDSALTEAAKALGISSMETTMVNLAVICVSEVLDLFNTSVTGVTGNNFAAKHIAPGFMLHMFSMNNVVDQVALFNHDNLQESAIGYKIIYSGTMAVVEGNAIDANMYISELLNTDNGLKTINSSITALGVEIANDLSQGKDVTAKEANLKSMQDIYNTINKSHQEIVKNLKMLAAKQAVKKSTKTTIQT